MSLLFRVMGRAKFPIRSVTIYTMGLTKGRREAIAVLADMTSVEQCKGTPLGLEVCIPGVGWQSELEGIKLLKHWDSQGALTAEMRRDLQQAIDEGAPVDFDPDTLP